tara:strand:+ start:1725 stop:2060 length:336 start_codon:yes stop_codon:yes gene_type:complete
VKNKLRLLENLLNNNLKLVNFFQTDLTKYKILLITMKSYYQNENQTIEKIIESLPKDISSRAHQLNCITDATIKGYLIKETSQSDLRKKYLRPSGNLISEFEKYLKLFSDK